MVRVEGHGYVEVRTSRKTDLMVGRGRKDKSTRLVVDEKEVRVELVVQVTFLREG